MLGCYLPYLKDTLAKVGPPGKNGQSWDPRGQDFRGNPLPHKPWDQEVKWPRGCNRLAKALVSAQLGLDSFQKLSTPSSLQKSCLLSHTQSWHRRSDPVRCLWRSMLSFPEVTAFSVRTMKITWCFTKGGGECIRSQKKLTFTIKTLEKIDRQKKSPGESHCHDFASLRRQYLMVRKGSLMTAPGASLETFLVRNCNKCEASLHPLPRMVTKSTFPWDRSKFPILIMCVQRLW